MEHPDKLEIAHLRALLMKVTVIAINQLYEQHQEDTAAEFTVDELRQVSTIAESLRPQQVEHIYREAFNATLTPSSSTSG